MANWKRWTLRIVTGLVTLLVLAMGAVYALSVRAISRKYPVREVHLPPPTDSASLARGAHLVQLSCRGCHGPDLAGTIMFDQPLIARIVAPDLIARLPNYTDGQLAGYLRYGMKPDGSASFTMPPAGFFQLADADLASIIAYLRTLPARTSPASLPTNAYGPVGRLGIVLGQFSLAITAIDTTAPRLGNDTLYLSTRQGEYLARLICSDCHGAKLVGDPAFPSPSIAGAVGYNEAQFGALLRTGTPRDPARKIPTMGQVFQVTSHLRDEELAAVYRFVSGLPTTGIPGVK